MTDPYHAILSKDVESLTEEDIAAIVKHNRELRVKFEAARAAPKKPKKGATDEPTEL